LRLAVQRQVIGIFGDQNLGDGCLGRNAALDQASRSGGLDHDLFASPASILWAAHHQNAELGGHNVQLLADILADPMQIMAAARTGMVIDIDCDLDARQVCW
jgi:hypothetical protein